MVTKGNGDWRPCGDYRKLNSVTVPDRYPVPHIQDCLQVLEGKKIFCTLDLAKAYHQIPVQEEDVSQTAVATPFRLFEFLYMPFGLSNVSATFQRSKKNDKTPIAWTEEARDAFENCKHDFAEATVLYHPSANANLAIVVDASDDAVGAALQQQVTASRQPLEFYSKSLSPAQRRYSADDRELLAAYMAINPHIDKCSYRQLRQLDLNGQFTTDIRHLKGTGNVVADALSRVHISTIGLPSAIDFQKMAEERQTDHELKDILSSNTTSLVPQPLPVGEPPVTLHCDVSLAGSAHSFQRILDVRFSQTYIHLNIQE
ncbi:Retrovirus-related Pol polyprotein from transposon 297 [Araneus ventricosus]|uniref:Retrovirus-related Pol polyprotein from transposon 297 n=1 Tax=Araneus ventricosus TaxID=182803 RepID=A0A4Y2NK25_ARAVE|nr:Retrovirus-related Pol polyprotein from transposon 297 [Araneus ventricosus]